ncbi:MAG: winged helix-turn-helix transcriptional regulator [Candidatus Thorarchaeota archaeon]
MAAIDSIDRRILWELDANCRVSYEQPSRKLEMTANAVKKRLDNLVKTGIIVRFMVLPHNAVIDAEFVSGIVYTNGSENQHEFVEAMGGHPVIHHVSPLVSISGGAYHIFGQYQGPEMLLNMGQFLRGLDVVTDVRIYPTLYPPGEKIEITKLEMRVLSCLLKNPRMQINEIAEGSGLTTRMARKVLRQLEEGGGVRFTVRWDVNAGDNVTFWIAVSWDPKSFSHEDIKERLANEFPGEYWTSLVAATEPTIFARFVVDDLPSAYRIVGQVRQASFVRSTEVFVCYSTAAFPWLGESLLEEMLIEAGVHQEQAPRIEGARRLNPAYRSPTAHLQKIR